jgi:hypothetical protein
MIILMICEIERARLGVRALLVAVTSRVIRLKTTEF